MSPTSLRSNELAAAVPPGEDSGSILVDADWRDYFNDHSDLRVTHRIGRITTTRANPRGSPRQLLAVEFYTSMRFEWSDPLARFLRGQTRVHAQYEIGTFPFQARALHSFPTATFFRLRRSKMHILMG